MKHIKQFGCSHANLSVRQTREYKSLAQKAALGCLFIFSAVAVGKKTTPAKIRY